MVPLSSCENSSCGFDENICDCLHFQLLRKIYVESFQDAAPMLVGARENRYVEVPFSWDRIVQQTKSTQAREGIAQGDRRTISVGGPEGSCQSGECDHLQ